jgi:uncharacterized protein YbjT (DUF2867 family)
VAIARKFSAAQKNAIGPAARERPIVELTADELSQSFAEWGIEIVVNCVGVLQDGARGSSQVVHRAFVERLATSLGSIGTSVLLVHVSIPGTSQDDPTSFSRTKRAAERAIASGSLPFVILRPGFVIAPRAYGGSALIRALAALPLDLPLHETSRPFAVTDVTDIARTVAVIARRWARGERACSAIWDVMADQPSTLGGVIEAFRIQFGGPNARITLPSWLLETGAKAGDLASCLGWTPPMRSTALQEIRRGVTGEPTPWILATGIEPISLAFAVRQLPATVQEQWFARLYLLKALVLAALVVFWAVSGAIALTIAFNSAAAILTSHGFPPLLANAVTVASSVVDISIGLAIAFKKTCRIGLFAGIAVSIFYMVGATVLAPEMWIEPLGALVKTGPAIVLMLVALAALENR